MGEEAWEMGDGYELALALAAVAVVEEEEARLDDRRRPGGGGAYCRIMTPWLGPPTVAASSSSFSLSPEKRVNCFCVSSTMRRAFRSR